MNKAIALVPILFAPLVAQDPPTVDAAQRREVVAGAGRLLTARYVFADKGDACASLLQKQLDAGAYDAIDDAGAFAQALTRDLQNLTHDKHLRVLLQRRERRGPDVDRAEVERRMRRQAAQRNYGFEKLERLSGNVGYLDLRGFMPAEVAGDTAVAAMAFLQNTDAVIIDLRQNGGGSPSMIQLISSYFFAEPTHLNSFFWRGKEQIDQFWTLPHVPGKARPDVPLYVLTSGRTFSAAEEFTYNMKNLERATIVGETTGGGAHPGGTTRIDDLFAVWIPQGRAINPITKTNWEGTGIAPHIDVPAERALWAAHREALKTIAENADDPREAQSLRWHITALEAKVTPVAVSDARLARLAGRYGPRTITVADGVLHYQREGRPSYRMIPLSQDVFQPEGLDNFRVRFDEKDGRVVRLVGLYDDGREDISARGDG